MEEDKAKLVIRLESSADSAAGAVTAYLLRRLAARAGAYAPGIQENLFYEIAQNANGSTLDKAERWVHAHSGDLAMLGYNILPRRTAAPTADVIQWVEEGAGFRAAVLAVEGTRLYSNNSLSMAHAVALMWSDHTAGIPDPALGSGLVMVDAWPAIPKFRRPPGMLDKAHRAYKYATLLLYWAGYS